jgi:uncharacterized protein YdaU (DUF1376 family)
MASITHIPANTQEQTLEGCIDEVAVFRSLGAIHASEQPDVGNPNRDLDLAPAGGQGRPATTAIEPGASTTMPECGESEERTGEPLGGQHGGDEVGRVTHASAEVGPLEGTSEFAATTRGNGRPSPAFQIYPDDWLSSSKIALMTPEEEAAYLRLLLYSWNSSDCSVPDDDRVLAIYTRLGASWKQCSANVKSCFVLREGRLCNLRLLDEWDKQNRFKNSKRQAGFESGRARRRQGLEKQGGSTPNSVRKEHGAKGNSPPVPRGHLAVPNTRRTKTNFSVRSSQFSDTPISPRGEERNHLAEPPLDERVDRLYRRHPKKKGRPLVESALLEILQKASEPEGLFAEIDRAHAAWCESADWTKEEGRWAPKLADWLVDQGWTGVPPDATTGVEYERYRDHWQGDVHDEE